MKVYVGQTRSKSLIADLTDLGFGECTQPYEYPPRRTPWFLDNGAFADWKAEREFNADRFRQAISQAEGADFLIVPDRVAQRDSLAFSRSWLSECKGSGVPCYLAVQDGMHVSAATIYGFDGVFVGGTLEWKIANADRWIKVSHRAGKPCHIGRVGTGKRVKWAKRIGADSIDSCLPLWSKDNLRIFVEALNHPQIEFSF